MAITTLFEGDRILLKPLSTEAISAEYVAWMKDPEVLQFLADPAGDYSLRSLTDFVRTMNDSPNNYLFGIFLKADQRHIGNVKIGSVSKTNGVGDIGIVIGDRSIWGQGYATEALCLVVRYAFEQLGLFKLYAGIVEGNEGSLRAFLKAGFKEVGRFRAHWIVNGIRRDQYILDILREGN